MAVAPPPRAPPRRPCPWQAVRTCPRRAAAALTSDCAVGPTQKMPVATRRRRTRRAWRSCSRRARGTSHRAATTNCRLHRYAPAARRETIATTRWAWPRALPAVYSLRNPTWTRTWPHLVRSWFICLSPTSFPSFSLSLSLSHTLTRSLASPLAFSSFLLLWFLLLLSLLDWAAATVAAVPHNDPSQLAYRMPHAWVRVSRRPPRNETIPCPYTTLYS